MSSDSSDVYRLTPKALDDLEEIWRYTAEIWSIGQADTYIDDLTRVFRTLAGMPDMARQYTEIDPPVRIHTHQSHLIVYQVIEEDIVILRILGGRQDWHGILGIIG